MGDAATELDEPLLETTDHEEVSLDVEVDGTVEPASRGPMVTPRRFLRGHHERLSQERRQCVRRCSWATLFVVFCGVAGLVLSISIPRAPTYTYEPVSSPFDGLRCKNKFCSCNGTEVVTFKNHNFFGIDIHLDSLSVLYESTGHTQSTSLGIIHIPTDQQIISVGGFGTAEREVDLAGFTSESIKRACWQCKDNTLDISVFFKFKVDYFWTSSDFMLSYPPNNAKMRCHEQQC